MNPVPCVNVALLAACPGAAHGFFGRHGGASAAPLDSLNISSRVGDSRAAVQENRLRLRRAAGLEAARFLSLSQVHGRNIVQVGGETFAAIEADGVWTRAPQLALCIQTADCVPLLFADVQGELVAAAHAGWRGTQAQIGAAMVERLAAAAVAPSRLRVALGPAIGPCCFLIGHDVAQALRGSVAGGDAYVQPRGELWTADLWALNLLQLTAAGVEAAHVEVVRQCTACDSGFFSHRRDQAKTGRQGSIIGLQGH